MITANFIENMIINYNFKAMWYDDNNDNVLMSFNGHLTKSDILDVYSLFLGVAAIDENTVVANYNEITNETIVSMWK